MEWINVKDKPIPSCGRLLAGLYVINNITHKTEFEYYDLEFDEYDICQIYENMSLDYFTNWEREDFEYWAKIEEPKQKGK